MFAELIPTISVNIHDEIRFFLYFNRYNFIVIWSQASEEDYCFRIKPKSKFHTSNGKHARHERLKDWYDKLIKDSKVVFILILIFVTLLCVIRQKETLKIVGLRILVYQKTF